MLNLNVYKLGELQNFMAMLNQCEQHSVSEIRFVRQEIQNFLDNHAKKTRLSYLKENKNNIKIPRRVRKQILQKVPKIICPSCNIGRLLPLVNDEGLNIWMCKKCRYSTIMEVQDVK